MTKIAIHTSMTTIELTSPITPACSIACCPLANCNANDENIIPARARKNPNEDRIIAIVLRAVLRELTCSCGTSGAGSQHFPLQQSVVRTCRSKASVEVSSAVQEFLSAKRHLSPYTRRSYTQRLGVFAQWCKGHSLDMEQLSPKAVRAFIEDVSKRPVQASTLRVYATAVKTLLRWCAKEDDLDIVISPTIAARVEPIPVESKVIETYSDVELVAFFQAAEEGDYAVRNKAILSVLIDTGARVGEVVSLTTDCVWLEADDSYILVRGKGK